MNAPIQRRSVLLTVAFFIVSLGRIHAADLRASYEWRPMKIGGGGWVTGLDINARQEGLLFARTDVSGAYRWEASAGSWKQVVTWKSMPQGSLVYGGFSGVDSLVGSAKDPQIAYMAFSGQPYEEADGEIYRSENRGDTWTATGFRSHAVKMEANGDGRQEGERLAVDPLNSDIVYYGSISDGLWLTRNGGRDWSRAEGVPGGHAKHGVNTIAFDDASRGAGTKTDVIYVTVDAVGVFRSSDAGSTWTKISDPGQGNASRPRDAEIGPDHTYYVAFDNEEGATGSVWKYSAGLGWTDITPPSPEGGSKSYWDLAVDPTDARRIVVMRNGGCAFVSTDQGVTWTTHEFRLTSPVIRWQGRQSNYFLSVGEIAFDPFSPGKLWFAEGFGVWWADNLTTAEIEWHSASEGIEETCGNDVIAPPGGKPVAAMWDVGAFYFSDPDAYTARKSHPGFMSCWALDWCAATPGFIAAVFRNHLGLQPYPNSAGFSTDGGRTWRRFDAIDKNTLPAELDYGVVAVSANSPEKIVWAPAHRKLPYHTEDRGATWHRSSFGGGETETGLDAHYSSQKPLCADRVLADTFYFYRTQGGVYRSTDGGATFSKVGSPPSGRTNAVLKATPGRARDLWFAGGAGEGLWRSIDGGETWEAVPGLQQAMNVGFGMARERDGYPTVFVAGVSNGRNGIFRSTDAGRIWDQVGDFPLGITDWIDALDGDKDVFGTVYVAFAGAGFAYGKPAIR